MDLGAHLRYFVAVAEHRHFGRAAASLGVTQPPVSQGLRRLEKRLGLQLIERTPDGARLTSDGAELLPRARLIVEDSARFLDDARQMVGALQGVRWGVIPQLDDELVVRCVDGIRGTLESSQAVVSTVTASTAQLVNEVRRGTMQLAVVQHPVLVDGIDAGPVVTVARSVVLPAGHRAAAADAPRAQMLDGLVLATVPREDNPAAHDLLIDQLRRRGLDPQTRPAATHREVAAAVASGSCFGLATSAAPVHTGTVHRRMLVDETALRLRVVSTTGANLGDAVYAVDRQLLRADR